MTGQPVLALSAIILLLGICGPAADVAENVTHANNTAAVSPNTTVPENPPANITPPKNDTEVWRMINRDMVEAACLQAAKGGMGDAAWAVKGCSCEETAGADSKRYDCAIGLAGGLESPATLDCGLTARKCDVASEFGNYTLTFDEIIEFSNR